MFFGGLDQQGRKRANSAHTIGGKNMKSLFASLSLLALMATGCSTCSSGKCPLDIRGQSPDACKTGACNNGACNNAACRNGQCPPGYGQACPSGCPQGCPQGYCPHGYGGHGFGGGLSHLNPLRNGFVSNAVQTPNHYHWYQYDEPKNITYPQANTPAAIVQYPYYTLKGPEDFFME